MAAKGGNIQLVDWLIEEQGFDVHQWINVSAEGQPGTKPLPMCVCQRVVVDLIYVRYSSSLTQASFEYGICVLYVHVRTCGTCEWFLVRVASLCTQGGRFNCLRCAARYGRTELFHHLVQRYDCNPKEKDCCNGVSSTCVRLCVQRGVRGTVGSRVICNMISIIFFMAVDKWWLDCPSHLLLLWSPRTDKRFGFQIQTGPQ